MCTTNHGWSAVIGIAAFWTVCSCVEKQSTVITITTIWAVCWYFLGGSDSYCNILNSVCLNVLWPRQKVVMVIIHWKQCGVCADTTWPLVEQRSRGAARWCHTARWHGNVTYTTYCEHSGSVCWCHLVRKSALVHVVHVHCEQCGAVWWCHTTGGHIPHTYHISWTIRNIVLLSFGQEQCPAMGIIQCENYWNWALRLHSGVHTCGTVAYTKYCGHCGSVRWCHLVRTSAVVHIVIVHCEQCGAVCWHRMKRANDGIVITLLTVRTQWGGGVADHYDSYYILYCGPVGIFCWRHFGQE